MLPKKAICENRGLQICKLLDRDILEVWDGLEMMNFKWMVKCGANNGSLQYIVYAN